MDVLNFLFNLNLIILAIDHFVTGGSAFLYPERAIKMYKIIFGAELPPNDEYMAIIKPWGALGVFAGYIGLLPLIDPVKFRAILYGLLILLLVRIYIRLSNTKRAEKYFRLSVKRNLFHVFLIATSALMVMLQILAGA
jgi:hypothetical protein